MARLSGSGSSIKVWLEKWVLDQLLINVVHGGRSMGIDLQERVDKLKIKSEKDPRPYKISWFKKGNEVRLHSSCEISLLLANPLRTR